MPVSTEISSGVAVRARMARGGSLGCGRKSRRSSAAVCSRSAARRRRRCTCAQPRARAAGGSARASREGARRLATHAPLEHRVRRGHAVHGYEDKVRGNGANVEHRDRCGGKRVRDSLHDAHRLEAHDPSPTSSTAQRVSSTAMSPGSKAARSVASAMMEIDSLEPLVDSEIEKKRRASSSRSLKKMSSSSVAKQALTRSSAKVATCTVLMGVSMTCVEERLMLGLWHARALMRRTSVAAKMDCALSWGRRRAKFKEHSGCSPRFYQYRVSIITDNPQTNAPRTT